MSCIWQEREGGAWQARALLAGRLLPGEELALAGIAVMALSQGAALLVKPGVRARVNGEPVLGGLRLLDHKDEILIGPRRFVFSGETTPIITTAQVREGQRTPVCPVCRGPVRDGTPAVECPGCGRWVHQLDAKPCWTYAPTCRFCNHPTSFDASAAWRPDREESLV